MKWVGVVMAFACGMLVGCIFDHYALCGATLPSRFYDITLVDILDILLKLCIAVFITAAVSKRLSHEARRREIQAECIGTYEQGLDSLYDSFSQYCKAPSKELSQEVLRRFKASGMLLSLAVTICQSKRRRKTSVDLEKDFLSLKAAVTDSPFGTERTSVKDTARLDKIDTAFRSARKSLVTEKLSLYKC